MFIIQSNKWFSISKQKFPFSLIGATLLEHNLTQKQIRLKIHLPKTKTKQFRFCMWKKSKESKEVLIVYKWA